MKKLIFAVACLFSVNAIASENPGVVYNFKVIRVVDGDTVEIEANFLPAPLKPKLAIRVFGVDTPEKGFRAACDKERAMGESATEFTKKAVAGAKSTLVELKDWDKFGGRVLGDVIIDGKSLRGSLIEKGYARPYFGDKKQSWCQ